MGNVQDRLIASIKQELAIMSVSTLFVVVMATTATAGPTDNEIRDIQEATTLASVRLYDSHLSIISTPVNVLLDKL